jgi:hypothetical protein
MLSTASFTFSGTDANGVTAYRCSLDGGAFATCASPQSYSGLANGNHVNGSLPQPYTAPFVLTRAGTYQITYSSVDKAGNVAAQKTLTVTVAP